jgi:hypothetical protein
MDQSVGLTVAGSFSFLGWQPTAWPAGCKGVLGPGVSHATCRQTNRMTHDTDQPGGDMEPIGNLLDALGIMHTPDDGELVASAVVLLKVLDNDGDVSLRIVCSDGLSWIERLGMLRAAEHVELPAASETVE